MNATTRDLVSKNILITGANTGIGKATARALAKRGAQLTIACRSQEKAQEAIAEIQSEVPDARIDFLAIDLADLAQVSKAADEFLSKNQSLDILINNAGLAGFQGQTKQGFEIQFGVNHVGPYLFTKKLLPILEKASEARIVNVASRAHRVVKTIDFDAVTKPTKTTTGYPEYGVSKLANVLHAQELAKRLPSHVHTYSLHPGVVASDVWRRIPNPIRWIGKAFMITNEEGALTSLHCATSSQAGNETGLYYDKQRVAETNASAKNPVLQQELWDRSEDWTSKYI